MIITILFVCAAFWAVAISLLKIINDAATREEKMSEDMDNKPY